MGLKVPSVDKSVDAPGPGVENEGVAEYMDLATDNDTTTQLQQGLSTTNQIQLIFIVPVNPNSIMNTNGNRVVELDHTYSKRKKHSRP